MVASITSNGTAGMAARSAAAAESGDAAVAAGAAGAASIATEPVDTAAAGVRMLRQLNEGTPVLRAQFTAPQSGADAPTQPPDFIKDLTAKLTAELDERTSASAERYITQDGARLVIEADGADDRITVRQDSATGELSITINGVGHRFEPGQAESVTIRTLGGNDSVQVDADVTQAIDIEGGDGDDVLVGGGGADRIDGGAGNDYVSGGTGDDRLRGDAGDDTLYGGAGGDVMDGGDGKDYLDGWRGNDQLSGGAGADVISRVQDEDRLPEPADGDVVYTATAASRAALPRGLVVVGDAAFRDRMQADLETLSASDTGSAMLAEIARLTHAGARLVIEEGELQNGLGGGVTGKGIAVINPAYGPARSAEEVPPIVVLYHELAHARAGMAGVWAAGAFADAAQPGHVDTGVPNAEHQAVGLPVDHDLDPATPAIPDPHTPAALTENALRAEMGYPLRESYR